MSFLKNEFLDYKNGLDTWGKKLLPMSNVKNYFNTSKNYWTILVAFIDFNIF